MCRVESEHSKEAISAEIRYSRTHAGFFIGESRKQGGTAHNKALVKSRSSWFYEGFFVLSLSDAIGISESKSTKIRSSRRRANSEGLSLEVRIGGLL